MGCHHWLLATYNESSKFLGKFDQFYQTTRHHPHKDGNLYSYSGDSLDCG